MAGSLGGGPCEVVRPRSGFGQTSVDRGAAPSAVPAESAAVPHPAPIAFGPFVLDAAEARLTRDGRPLALNGRPLQVLALLASRPGQLLDKDAVLDGVWGHRHVTESVLKGAVNTLRAALGDDARAPRYVETVPRRGYRFIAPLQAPAAGTAATADAAAADPADAAPAGNLPPPGSGAAALIGRESELAALPALLLQHRLLTITGLGGVGKTRLALAVAAATEAPPHGRWLVRLDGLQAPADEALLAATVAQALALGPAAGTSTPALARALAPLRLLLVLDNAEHLHDAVAALVAALRAAAPGLLLLVTSQRPLHLAGEPVWPLAPLALPQAIADAAPDPGGYAAARLFCARVQQAAPGWQPGPADAADIAAICRGLDGVPLALELAAARVPLLGVAGVRARLDQRFALLTRGPRDAAERHRTLAAALDWTCGLLAPAEREALQLLALLHGRFDVDTAEALLGDAALDLVDALRERSLLVVEPGGGLRLFESVRRFALDALAAGGGLAAARQRHLQRLLARFERAEREEFGTPLQRWLPPLRDELDNLRAALADGLQPMADDDVEATSRRGATLRLLAASAMFWARSGLRQEGLAWFQRARGGPAASAPVQALLDHGFALFCTHAQTGAPDEALAALRRSRTVPAALQEPRRRYLSLYAERMLLMRLAPREDVTALLAAMRAQVQPGWGALALRYLDMLEALRHRDAGDVIAYAEGCRAIARRCRADGGRIEAWAAENALAQALALQGRLDEACEAIGTAADDAISAGADREQVTLIAIAACLHLWRRADAGALALARRAVRLLQAEGMLWWMVDALAWAAWHDGRGADAARLQAWADAVVQRRGEQRGPLFTRLRAAMREALAGREAIEGDAAALDEAAALELAFGPAPPA